MFLIMDRIDGMKTFVAAYEAGSFTAAADRLNMSKKLVSKYIGQLEAHLNIRLLHRTTRSLRPTEEGQRYYEGCIQVLAEIDQLEAGLTRDQKDLRGNLRISAPVDYGMEYVLPVIDSFQEIHPDVTVDLNLTDRYVDLTAEGYDLAIRLGDLADSTMIARKIGTSDIWIVAAPDMPGLSGISTPEDLPRFPCIQDTNATESHLWQIGKRQRIRISGLLKVNSALAVRKAAINGRGVALLPDLFARDAVERGELTRVLPDITTRSIDIQLVYQKARQPISRLLAFIDHASQALRSLT